MKVTHITREHLRAMSDGESIKFELPDVPSIYSGRAQCHQLAAIENCRFQTEADYKGRALTVTRYDNH